MPREIEYQLRSILAALALFIGTSSYDDRFRDNFWANATSCVGCYFVACLILLWHRPPDRDIHPIKDAIDKLSHMLHRAFHGKDVEVREKQAQERELDNGSGPNKPP